MEANLWSNNTLQEIEVKTADYTAREKENMRIPFLLKSIVKVENKDIEEEDRKEFRWKVEQLILLLPEKQEGKRVVNPDYLKASAMFKNYVLRKFNLVSKGTYLKICLVMGIVLGLLLGAVFGQMLIGTLFGVGLGLILGSYLGKKATVENRVL